MTPKTHGISTHLPMVSCFQNTIGRWFDIPWVWDVMQNRIDRWFDLALGGYSIYHGLRGVIQNIAN
jgi:hypothetical protein